MLMSVCLLHAHVCLCVSCMLMSAEARVLRAGGVGGEEGHMMEMCVFAIKVVVFVIKVVVCM